MRILLFSCSEVSILDGRYNTISLINLIEEINSITLPAVIPKVSICFILQREDNEPLIAPATVSVKIGETALFEQKIDIDFHERLQVRNIVELQGLLVSNPGKIIFSLQVGDDIRAEWPIQVTHIGEPQGVAVVS